MTIFPISLEDRQGPKYRTIADAIATALQQGQLTPGQRLPTHRELADQLGVTVGTVTRAYAEAARRGLLRGEIGRGSFLSGGNAPSNFSRMIEVQSQQAVDLGMAIPLSHLDPSLSEALGSLTADPQLQGLLHYQASAGRWVDRETGCMWLQRYGLAADPEHVLVCGGGQQALAVILSSVFRAGDAIAVEQFTYSLFKGLARRFQLRLVPVEMDQEGMMPKSLERACQQNRLKGIYCMPTLQNPTTAHMGEKRRIDICSICEKEDLLIIEDDAYGLQHPEPFTPLTALASERSFFIGSVSKSLSAGLRVAYMHCPTDYLHRLEQGIAELSWMACPLSARIARLWIGNGTADQTIQRKRTEAQCRNDLACEMLQGKRLSYHPNGYFIWLHLPIEWNATDFARAAGDQQVRISPDEHFIVGRHDNHNAIRIAISSPSRMDELERGLRIIQELLR